MKPMKLKREKYVPSTIEGIAKNRIVPFSMLILCVKFTKIPENAGNKTVALDIQRSVDMSINVIEEKIADISMKLCHVVGVEAFHINATTVNFARKVLVIAGKSL